MRYAVGVALYFRMHALHVVSKPVDVIKNYFVIGVPQIQNYWPKF